MDTYNLELAIPEINQTSLNYFNNNKLEPFSYQKNKHNYKNTIGGPLTLRRCPTRMSQYIGKYSFIIHYDDFKFQDRIYVLDYGLDLYETPRGIRKLFREIKKQYNCKHISI